MIASASVARFDGLFRSSERSIHIAGIRTQETQDTTARIDPSVAPSDPTTAAQPQAAMVPSEPAMEAATAETAEPEVSPAMPEPLMIELVSDPPQEEPGRSAAEPTLG